MRVENALGVASRARSIASVGIMIGSRIRRKIVSVNKGEKEEARLKIKYLSISSGGCFVGFILPIIKERIIATALKANTHYCFIIKTKD